jgi:hypothetical protein
VFRQFVILSANRISHAKKESVKAVKISIKIVKHALFMREDLFAFHVILDIRHTRFMNMIQSVLVMDTYAQKTNFVMLIIRLAI